MIYDKFDIRNFAQVYSAFCEANFEVEICAYKEEVRENFGFALAPTRAEESLSDYDILVLCDGDNKNLEYNDIFLSWLRSGIYAKHKICFLGSAGLFESAEFSEFTSLESTDEFANFIRNL